jgi:hypothetical protein
VLESGYVGDLDLWSSCRQRRRQGLGNLRVSAEERRGGT